MSGEFDKLSADEVIKELKTDLNGLSEEEVNARRAKYGPNSITEIRENPFLKLLKKFSAPIPWMLEITAIITFVLGKYLDSYIIISLLVFNGLISYIQELKATDAVAMLSSKIRVNARVCRNAVWKQISASDLVPGDIIHIRMGDIVPADLKVISGIIDVDQSSLTGESRPVRLENNKNVYSGSIVKKGEATCVVTATGGSTFFGKTTELVQIAKASSHLETLILSIIRYLVVIDTILVVSLVIFTIAVGIPITETIPFALVVLIASIPVALPATFTIASAYGAIDLSQKGALVTRLTAIEDAASMDVICFDKTGTLTQNKLTVMEPIPFNCSEEELISAAFLASDESSQDSIDLAVIRYARSAGVNPDRSSVKKFVPFDPGIKRTEAIIGNGIEETKLVKGAPQVVLKLCEGVDYDAQMNRVIELAKRGYRTIAAAKCNSSSSSFLGLIPLVDAPREDSNELVLHLKDLGISTKMVTGDSTAIAQEIAKKVGIGERICKAKDVISGRSDVESCDVFAEVFPEDKYDIVKLLQQRGHITGMTGDGVNDAPALKQAEVGIAVSSGTDVAKASASIVLTHEGLRDVVSAVEDGRKIYQRMLTYTLNKIIKTIQVAIFLTVSFFIIRYFVTTPFDIILLLFANDFVTMSIATDNVRYSNSPEKWNVKSLVGSSGSLAFFVIVESFLVLLAGSMLKLHQAQMNTFIFDMLVFSGLFTVFIVRERGRFWHSRPSKWMLAATAGDILVISVLSIFGILIPSIPAIYVLIVLAITLLSMVVIDEFKSFIFRHYNI